MVRAFPNFPGLSPSTHTHTHTHFGKHIAQCLQGFCFLFDIPYLQSKQNVPFNTYHAKFINEENNPRGSAGETLRTCQEKLFKHSTRQILQNDISHNEVKIIFSFRPFQPLLWTADRNYFLTLLPEQRSVWSGVYLFNMMISSSTSRQQIVGRRVNKGPLKRRA